jgi:hypothetical protein
MSGSLLLVLLVDVEDGRGPFGSEFRGECRGLLASELPVVRAPHLVAPPVTVGDGERDALFFEHPRKGLLIDRAGVGKRDVDLVAEGLFEPSGPEGLPPELPVGLGLLGVGEHAQALVAHEVVVQLAEPVLPAGVALERLPGEVVVVGHEDVRMRVTTC